VLRTLAPLRLENIATSKSALDLHVLSTPPAFVLSQNQTLRIKTLVDSCLIVKSDSFIYLVKLLKISELTSPTLKGLSLIAQFNFQRAVGVLPPKFCFTRLILP
jgi:hypothetical protein